MDKNSKDAYNKLIMSTLQVNNAYNGINISNFKQ